MEYNKVLKFLQIIGYTFIILSIIEIVFVIILNFTGFNIDGNYYLLYEFIYFSSLVLPRGTFLWIFFITSMCCFLIMGIFLHRMSLKTTIESRPLAKYIVVIGMIILIGGFITMNYLVLLGRTIISQGSFSVTFQNALYDFIITPIMPAIFWIFFISVNCSYLIAGLLVTATGIKWSLLLRPEAQ